jgi:hypothetical protein
MGEEQTKIEFVVGEQYENEKGSFTVVSKKRDQMVIRWDNGDELVTSLELQRRIAERRLWEKENPPRAAGKTAGKRSAARKSSQGKAFSGFAATDFKTSAAGTRWRSRGQLGGAVVGKIKAPHLNLNSWAFSHKPEMHIQDARYRDGDADSSDARFFVRLDKNTLSYGFRVARTEASSLHGDHFVDWLQKPENLDHLRSLSAEEGVVARDCASAEAVPAGDPASACESILEKSGGFDLELFAVQQKKEAVESGAGIASAIAALLTKMVPLYRAAIAG